MKPHASRRQHLIQGASLVLLLGAGQLARGAQILAVRLWPARDYTRVTLESDTALLASHSLLTDPPRLAIDIEGLQLQAAFGIGLEHGVVGGHMRVVQHHGVVQRPAQAQRPALHVGPALHVAVAVEPLDQRDAFFGAFHA